MSDSPNLLELLQKPMSDFPDLPELPAEKHFYGKLLDIEARKSSKLQTPHFHFSIRLTDRGKDVSEAEMEKVANAGFSLSDYNCGADYYITPNAMKMLRRFMTSLGFPENKSVFECLALDDLGNPTGETKERIRGVDVLIKTPAKADNGRVYLNNVDCMGLKNE